MHQVVFLGARLPLTKTFVSESGRLSATPYPHVSRVTSYHEQVSDLAGFKALLDDHASKNHCLFGGQLSHPLTQESRAGKTKAAPRTWVVFDFDKVEAKDYVEVVAKYLPPECQNVSYVVQLSASMFRPDVTSWSGHIFMLLKDAVDEQRIKQWFEYLNFNLPALTSQISLSDSLQALHWPLDRTVAYGSKLIYIAPPKCIGFEPAIKQHILLVKKKVHTLTIAPFSPIDNVVIRQKINELRRSVGENEIGYEVTQYEGHEMLRKTDICNIEGIKASGDHYIRFNLNGGDSYAYFIDLRNPDIIRNFKGEPFLKTQDAAPDLYKSLRKSAAKATSNPPLEDGSDVLAFYATNQNSKLKIGAYHGETKLIELNNATIDSAKSWLYAYGMVQKEPFDHRYLVFNPKDATGYVPGSNTINLFAPSKYMQQNKSTPNPSSMSELPPVFNKCLRSALGPCPENVVEHFVNWLAYILQYRDKAQTAWVLSGVEGTGKNTLVKWYLRPIFGSQYVESVQYSNLEKEFNGFLEKALLVVIEEADTKSVENLEGMGAKLRHWITDSPLQIRRMTTDHMELENFSSFLFFTNKPTAAPVSGTDRRYNFGEYQDTKWTATPNEVRTFTSGSELEQLADVLLRWPVKVEAVRQIIETQARRDAYEAGTSINQLIAEAIHRGDLQFFVDRMPSDAEAASDFAMGNRFNPLSMFKANIARYQDMAERGEESVISEEEAFVLFRTLIPDPRYLQDSKTWRKRHYKQLGLDFDKQHRVGKNRVRGHKTQWQPATNMSVTETDKSVTNITGKKRA